MKKKQILFWILLLVVLPCQASIFSKTDDGEISESEAAAYWETKKTQFDEKGFFDDDKKLYAPPPGGGTGDPQKITDEDEPPVPPTPPILPLGQSDIAVFALLSLFGMLWYKRKALQPIFR